MEKAINISEIFELKVFNNEEYRNLIFDFVEENNLEFLFHDFLLKSAEQNKYM